MSAGATSSGAVSHLGGFSGTVSARGESGRVSIRVKIE
ncbi:hypothetical protein Sros_9242 [Streptosporangium roseum DSM 43021]|uniref:Uncharacterized protein n=1 Tax=Streptosporangium roseum (strain ATCC 12428 / DSM 43021 / JCM 3005 / KCTC 9067 / NCIMB 10171 / NRRL 2505 / NI 9100) TaxID=479432 RepID=D2BCP0_STRRD|nr:hypothetical protein Sros_9242 [Streptosporangium roseum DSM 43021]